jgi:hypothetical protein
LWQFARGLSPEDNITALLGKMAIYRQVKMDQETLRITLEMYTDYLKNLDLRAFQVAMAVLSENPREDGQTAFPSLGDILAAMEEAREVWPNFAEGREKILTDPVVAEPQIKRLTK